MNFENSNFHVPKQNLGHIKFTGPKVFVETGIQVENFNEYWGQKPETQDAEVQSPPTFDNRVKITPKSELSCQTEK